MSYYKNNRIVKVAQNILNNKVTMALQKTEREEFSTKY